MTWCVDLPTSAMKTEYFDDVTYTSGSEEKSR